MVVKFGGNYTLQVDGTLTVDGATFTSGKEVPGQSDWWGIKFNAGSTSSLRNSIIEYAYSGIYCDSSSPLISGNTIRNNSSGIYLAGSSSPFIENNEFTGNNTSIYADAGSAGGLNPIITGNKINCKFYGIYIYGRNSTTLNEPQLLENTISECSGVAIYYQGNVRGVIKENNITSSNQIGTAIVLQGLGSASSPEKNPFPQINQNNVLGYQTKISAGGYAAPSSLKIDAKENWWGTTDTFEISLKIMDYSDNENIAPVIDWSYFLNAPYPDGVPVVGNYVSGGDLPCNETWYANNSPYILLGSPLVKQNCVFNITQGTVVRSGGYFTLKVDGKIIVDGAHFISLKVNPGSNDWGGIWFRPSSSRDSKINNSSVKNANRGINIDSVKVEITGSSIEDCQNGIYIKNASPLIRDNQIKNNGNGIVIEGNSSPDIINNFLSQQVNISFNDSRGIFSGTISDNTIRCSGLTGTAGIYISGGIYIDTRSEPEIKVNRIEYCAYGIYLQGNIGGRIEGWNIITENGTGITLLGALGKTPLPLINNNSIYNNVNYQITVAGGYSDPQNTQIDARYNYFGTINGEEIRTKLYDYQNNPSYSARLLWEPYRDAPGGNLYMWIWLNNPVPFGFSPTAEVVDFSSHVVEPSNWVVSIKDFFTDIEVRRYTVESTTDLVFVWAGEDEHGLILPEGWYSWSISAVSDVSGAIAIPQTSHLLMAGEIEPGITINVEIPPGSARAHVWGEYVFFPTDDEIKGRIKVWLDDEQNPFYREQFTTYSGTYEFYYDTCGLSNSVHTFHALAESRGMIAEVSASFDKNTIIPSLTVLDPEVNHDSMRSLILRGSIKFNDTGWYKQWHTRFEVKKVDSGDVLCSREYYYKKREDTFSYVCNLCSSGEGRYQIKVSATDCGVTQEVIKEVEY